MSRRPTATALAVAVPVVLAGSVGLGLALAGAHAGEATDPAGTVELTATDVVPAPSLAAMVDAAECTLAGEVVHTERGRAIGTDLVSRVVQLRVDQALAGDCPSGTVVLEEEGWVADGRAVTVNGWPGSAEGDVGVWFLVSGSSDELPYASTITSHGALRWRGGESLAPASAPAWVHDAVSDGPDALVAKLRTAGADDS